MLIEATSQPVRYQFRDGRQVRLELGRPVDLPEQQARALLHKAAGKVRVASTVTVEPAACRRLVYWESASGSLLGPATVSYFARVVEPDGREAFWLCVEFRDGWRWLHESRLRSCQMATACESIGPRRSGR